MVHSDLLRCLVVLGIARGAWWCMAVQCVLFVLFGAAWRCVVALGGAWWRLAVLCDWIMLRGGGCLALLRGALRCVVVLGAVLLCLGLRGAAWRCLGVLGGAYGARGA